MQVAAAKAGMHALLTLEHGARPALAIFRMDNPAHVKGLEAAADAALGLLHAAREAGDGAAQAAGQLFEPQEGARYSLGGTTVLEDDDLVDTPIAPKRCIDAYTEASHDEARACNNANLLTVMKTWRAMHMLSITAANGIMVLPPLMAQVEASAVPEWRQL